MPDDFTYKPQDINYLGFLEAQLRDLQDIATLAYELIQNADDVQESTGRSGATWISFDVTDEALIVTNDGLFRLVDFERLQNVAGGGKRAEAGTIGAFGIGFISVYQITDAPEIFSSGLHWTIRPDAPPEERIRERRVDTTGTRFRLPWAFDPASETRRTLRLPAVQPVQLDEFARALSQAIELAALFLRRLETLEVRRQGTLVRRIHRLLEPDGAHPWQRLRLQDESGDAATWLLFTGSFAPAATALRETYPWQIESGRDTTIHLALPTTGLHRHGRLFAGLPTAVTTPLPFHLDADFFPSTDRKRIHLAGGYQAEWNLAALHAAARLLATHLDALRPVLGHVNFWQLLQQVAHTHRLAEQGDLPAVFTTFWQALSPALAATPAIYTIQERWTTPAEARLLHQPHNPLLLSILQGLQIPLVHPDLHPYQELLRAPAIGTPPLAVSDLAPPLLSLGLTRTTPLHAAPPFLRSLEALQTLWQLLDNLLTREPTRAGYEQALAALAPLALVLTERMTLVRLDRVFHGDAETRTLFPQENWLHPSVPGNSFPGRFVSRFGVRQAVTLLAETPLDQLEETWRLGRLDLPRLFRWFEAHQIEIFADDPSLAPAIRRLPLSVVSGQLRPLAGLYVPGGFEDPLQLTGLVDLEALGGRRQFLEDLGVRELSFETYAHQELPRALAHHPDLPSDARHRLLHLLAARLGAIRDDQELREQLAALPLIPCMDGSFRAAHHVYLTRSVRDLLGEHARLAEPAPTEAVQALYRWLGVREQPTVSDLVHRLAQLAEQWGPADTPPDTVLHNIHQLWLHLQSLWEQEETAAALASLRQKTVIPNRHNHLCRPDQLFFADTPHVAARFPTLEPHLLPPDHATARVWAAAGVRPLSLAAQPRFATPPAAVPDHALQERIATRRPLLNRILLAEPDLSPDSPQLAFLADLHVLKAPALLLEYSLPFGPELLVSEPEPVRAWLEAAERTLYVTYDSPEAPPWPAVARELALAIKKQGPTGGLALAIKEVLAAASPAAAAAILNELGYPES